jgi:diadenosine tetraphosphate (Ap4A) HIT family hydrolase
VTLERLWAGWRMEYVEGVGDPDDADAGPCVFCRLLASDEPPESTLVVWRGETAAAVLNAFPYTSGHLLVMPVRHVAEIEELDSAEGADLWSAVTDGVRALKAAYRPDGLNLGANLGRSAGAGIPGHFHVHCIPRWDGDTSFLTTVGGTRVLPESIPQTLERVRAAWPSPDQPVVASS